MACRKKEAPGLRLGLNPKRLSSAAHRWRRHGQEVLSEAHPQAQREEAGSNPALPSSGGAVPPQTNTPLVVFADGGKDRSAGKWTRPALHTGRLVCAGDFILSLQHKDVRSILAPPAERPYFLTHPEGKEEWYVQ